MPEKSIPSRDHYAYVTRCAIRLFNQGALTHVTDIVVEPEYGYVTRLSYNDGSFRITYGNDLGLNPAAACDLSKDKGHTKFMLRIMDINTPNGKEFLLPWWAELIGESQKRRGNSNLRTISETSLYIESNLGLPVYIKPVSGSKGIGVYRAETIEEVQNVLEDFNVDRVRVAVVEEAIDLPDYRIVVLDGKLISAYQRKPLTVVGDGEATIQTLIQRTQQQYKTEGRDTIIDLSDKRIVYHLAKQGLNLSSQPAKDQEIELLAISNLSTGGTSEDVTGIIHNKWIQLAATIAQNFNLRLCGVDMVCADITSPDEHYSVLEVNAAPGLDHYASSGSAQREIVDQLYTKVLNAYPH